MHPKTLTRTLEHLQQAGLLEHHHDTETGNKATAARRKPDDYRLTTDGHALVDLIEELKRRTEERRAEDGDGQDEK